MDDQLQRGVGHANHVGRDAGQDEAVVLATHVNQRQIDGVNVRPEHVRLKERKPGILLLLHEICFYYCIISLR